jgi:hypothetical protein
MILNPAKALLGVQEQCPRPAQQDLAVAPAANPPRLQPRRAVPAFDEIRRETPAQARGQPRPVDGEISGSVLRKLAGVPGYARSHHSACFSSGTTASAISRRASLFCAVEMPRSRISNMRRIDFSGMVDALPRLMENLERILQTQQARPLLVERKLCLLRRL